MRQYGSHEEGDDFPDLRIRELGACEELRKVFQEWRRASAATLSAERV